MDAFDRTYLSNHIDRRRTASYIRRDTTVRRKEFDMETVVEGVKLVGPDNGREGFLGSIGVRFMIDGAEAAERFSLVEHPMSPRALAAPLHRHTREDEYSFVLEGRMGALLGGEVVGAGAAG